MENRYCITQIARTITELFNVQTGEEAEPIREVLDMAKEKFIGDTDRVFMYNPDAIAAWIYEKYIGYFQKTKERTDLVLPMLSVVPSVTPVCFASMYTGLQPEKHGIKAYLKPVLKIQTVFDVLANAGKKIAIVSTRGDSVSKIFLDRKIDYYIYVSMNKCNRKALQLIEEDRYDMIVLYNRDYDFNMHIYSPEGKRALLALKRDNKTYNKVLNSIEKHWSKHNTVVAFAMDHGCHKTDKGLGNHGLDIPEDMHINHLWSFLPEKKL